MHRALRTSSIYALTSLVQLALALPRIDRHLASIAIMRVILCWKAGDVSSSSLPFLRTLLSLSLAHTLLQPLLLQSAFVSGSGLTPFQLGHFLKSTNKAAIRL